MSGNASSQIWIEEREFEHFKRNIPRRLLIHFESDRECNFLLRGALSEYGYLAGLQERFAIGDLREINGMNERAVLIFNNEFYPKGLALVERKVGKIEYKTCSGKRYSSENGLEVVNLIGSENELFRKRVFMTYNHSMIKKPHYWSNYNLVFACRMGLNNGR